MWCKYDMQLIHLILTGFKPCDITRYSQKKITILTETATILSILDIKSNIYNMCKDKQINTLKNVYHKKQLKIMGLNCADFVKHFYICHKTGKNILIAADNRKEIIYQTRTDCLY